MFVIGQGGHTRTTRYPPPDFPHPISEETLVSTAQIINPTTREVLVASRERVTGKTITLTNS